MKLMSSGNAYRQAYDGHSNGPVNGRYDTVVYSDVVSYYTVSKKLMQKVANPLFLLYDEPPWL